MSLLYASLKLPFAAPSPIDRGCTAYTGWNDISVIDPVGAFILDSGEQLVLTSPGYPDHYDDDLFCNWLITSPDGTQIKLKLDEFNVICRCHYTLNLFHTACLLKLDGILL